MARNSFGIWSGFNRSFEGSFRHWLKVELAASHKRGIMFFDAFLCQKYSMRYALFDIETNKDLIKIYSHFPELQKYIHVLLVLKRRIENIFDAHYFIYLQLHLTANTLSEAVSNRVFKVSVKMWAVILYSLCSVCCGKTINRIKIIVSQTFSTIALVISS